jgi:hypothetical protein
MSMASKGGMLRLFAAYLRAPKEESPMIDIAVAVRR